MKVVKYLGIGCAGVILHILFLVVLTSIFSWINSSFRHAVLDDQKVVSTAVDLYGPGPFEVLDRCSTRTEGVAIREGEVVAPPGATCWVVFLSEVEAQDLGLNSPGGVRAFRGVPGMAIVLSRLAEYDTLSIGRVIAHEGQHLKDRLDGLEQSKLQSEVRAWEVSVMLYLQTLGVYGITTDDVLAGVCPSSVPQLDCDLSVPFLKGDREGFVKIIREVYNLP